jgi:3',5'-cyclic AMP phosphodiesterase CpdA
VNPVRIVVASDTHLSARIPATEHNWSAVIEHIDAAQPDLMLHLGDVSMDGTHDDDDLSFARRQMDRVPVRWWAVPGNHDLGDTPSAAIEPDEVVTADRVQRWVDRFGPDRWVIDLGAWKLVGVDAQLFGSGLASEDDQWDFIHAELLEAEPGRRRILVIHKPLTAAAEELATAPSYRFIPQPAQQRLWNLVRQAGVEAVVSGHVHQSRCLEVDGMPQLWAPTTWAVLPDSKQRTLGVKRCGLLQLELPEVGPVRHEFVEPRRMVQLTILDQGGYPPGTTPRDPSSSPPA